MGEEPEVQAREGKNALRQSDVARDDSLHAALIRGATFQFRKATAIKVNSFREPSGDCRDCPQIGTETIHRMNDLELDSQGLLATVSCPRRGHAANHQGSAGGTQT